MTIVVGIKTDEGIILGADSQGTADYDITMRNDKKIFMAHGIGYGFTTSYRMGQILQYHSKNVLSKFRKSDPHRYVVTCLVPMWRKALADNGYTITNNGRESNGQFMIALDGNLFYIDGDMQVAMHEDYYLAIGCGREYALGALFACDTGSLTETHVRLAVDAACKFSAGCGGQTKILKIS